MTRRSALGLLGAGVAAAQSSKDRFQPNWQSLKQYKFPDWFRDAKFDCWDSRYHSWNAVNHGPKRDIVGTWRDAARGQGLRFAVSEHLAWSYDWFNVTKGADKNGTYGRCGLRRQRSGVLGLVFSPA